MHAMLAGMSGVRELNLDEDEAKRIADATANVARHYIKFDIDEKTTDWTNLFLALGTVYGPRVMAFSMRRSREKEAAAKARQDRAETPQQPNTPQTPRQAPGPSSMPQPVVVDVAALARAN